MSFLDGEDLAPALPALSRAVDAFEPLDDSFGLAWARFTRGVDQRLARRPAGGDRRLRPRVRGVRGGRRPVGADPRAGRVLGHAARRSTEPADAYLAAGVARALGGRDRHPPRDDRPSRVFRLPDAARPDPSCGHPWSTRGAAMPREAGSADRGRLREPRGGGCPRGLSGAGVRSTRWKQSTASISPRAARSGSSTRRRPRRRGHGAGVEPDDPALSVLVAPTAGPGWTSARASSAAAATSCPARTTTDPDHHRRRS